MITVQNVEVRFEVEGDEDKQRFALLFNEFIERWSAEASIRQARELDSARERSLGDQPGDGGFA